MKTTEQILHQIKHNKQYKPTELRANTDIHLYLQSCLEDINKTAMFNQIDMDPRNGNKYIRGQRPLTRDILIKIFLYLQLDLNEYNQVFKNYGFPQLYAKNPRDAALIYCIHNNYSYLDTKRYLQNHKLELL